MRRQIPRSLRTPPPRPPGCSHLSTRYVPPRPDRAQRHRRSHGVLTPPAFSQCASTAARLEAASASPRHCSARDRRLARHGERSPILRSPSMGSSWSPSRAEGWLWRAWRRPRVLPLRRGSGFLICTVAPVTYFRSCQRRHLLQNERGVTVRYAACRQSSRHELWCLARSARYCVRHAVAP